MDRGEDERESDKQSDVERCQRIPDWQITVHK